MTPNEPGRPGPTPAQLYRWAMEGLKAQHDNGGWPQTVRELTKVWGFKSTDSAHSRLLQLEEAGYVESRPRENGYGKHYRFVDFEK